MKWKKIVALGMGVVMLGATLTGCADVRLSQKDYNQVIEDAKASVDITTDNAAAMARVDITTDNQKAIDEAISGITKDLVPDEIQKLIIEDAKKAEEEVEAETEAKGYTLDDLKIGAEFSKTLSDREIGLFDGEVKFDGDHYDAEEILILSGLRIAINEPDFKDNVYLTIPDEGIEYGIRFASDLDTGKIGEDETLEFDLLGEEVEVSDWSSNSVTFTKGTEKALKVNETFDYSETAQILVDRIGRDSVRVFVNGESLFIDKGETRDIEGIEIKLVRILDSDEIPSNDMVVLEIGEDVINEVDDGEEYNKDSIWERIINPSYAGLVLTEEFTEIDEDEDYMALSVGDEICLPNNYVCLEYNGITVEDTEEYSFDLDTKNGKPYVRVKGDFVKDIEDYDRLYINATGIYDEDLEWLGQTIDLAKAGYDNNDPMQLKLVGTNITIDDIKTNLDLDILEVDTIDISNKEDNYRTEFGSIIKNPDDNLEDNELEIVIPEEELTAEITITSK